MYLNDFVSERKGNSFSEINLKVNVIALKEQFTEIRQFCYKHKEDMLTIVG